MAKNWDTTLIFILLLCLFILARLLRLSRHYTRLKEVEGFTPKINAMYRPYVRDINNKYESFMNNYGPDVIMNKLKKWDIY
jgi:dolichol kinase